MFFFVSIPAPRGCFQGSQVIHRLSTVPQSSAQAHQGSAGLGCAQVIHRGAWVDQGSVRGPEGSYVHLCPPMSTYVHLCPPMSTYVHLCPPTPTTPHTVTLDVHRSTQAALVDTD